jgi:type I restriction-modification system DNA methylase subunit
MAKARSSASKSDDSGLNFEAQLWAAADKMRGHMDASEYKHVCLGLIFLKYISDAFEEKREQLLFGFSDPKCEWFIKDEPQRAEAAENRDEYLAANVFWLAPEARWHNIKAKAKLLEISKVAETVKFHAPQLANEWILPVTGDAVTKWAERIEFLLTGREGAFARATALREELAQKLDWQRCAAALLQKLAIQKT